MNGFITILVNSDNLFNIYENNLMDFYDFVQNNIVSIEGDWNNSQEIKITPSDSSLKDLK